MNYHQDYMQKNVTFFRLIMRVNFPFAIIFYILQIRIMNNNNTSVYVWNSCALIIGEPIYY